MTRPKRNAWALTILLGTVFMAGAWFMALRIEAFNKARHFQRWHAEPITRRDIRVPGFPSVRLDDEPSPDGRFALRLTYGDGAAPAAAPAVVLIPIRRPPAINLPDLGIYDEWLRVLAINEVVRDESGAQAASPGSERILIVVRRTPEGFDPETWGSVRRTEWLFDYYDLRPDGSIITESRRWPMSQARHEQAFQDRAAAPDADPRLRQLAAVPPLEERTIEYLAALHVIPKLNVPSYKFTDTAFSPRVLGWTLPVCMLSGLGLSFAFFFAVAPRARPSASQ